jgi:hypothetical protein
MSKDLLLYVRTFFIKLRSKLLDLYYKYSITGNKKSALKVLYDLTKIVFYEDYLISRYPNLEADELIACLEDCNFDLEKLRDRLKKLKGVNIDIIEIDLISY